MAKAFGIITSSVDQKVEGLQEYRPIGAISFMGRYRVIDFPISNLSNSGIINIQVYISSKPRSLAAHIGTGRHYNINSKRGRIQLLFPTEQKLNAVYNTNINALYENMDYIKMQHQEYVVIVPSCMVFTQDLNELLQDHAASGADITVLYHKVTDAKEGYSTCNEIALDGNRVKSITPFLEDTETENISMETYVMKKDLLLKLIADAKAASSMYTLANIINAESDKLDIRAVEHKGVFAPLTSLDSYFKASMAMLNKECAADLFSPDWPIYTRTSDSAPTRYLAGSSVKNSYISNGAVIEGTVENSIIARGVKIGKGAVVKNSIVMAYDTVGEGAVLENQVVDKYATIRPGTKVVAPEGQVGYVRHSDVL